MSNVSSARLKARYAAERRFRALGLVAVVFSALVLAFLRVSMTANAGGGFKRAERRLPGDFAACGMT
ncbi:MAG: phosphate transporter permease PstA, partial [Pseudomonadota bacterium]